MISKYKLDQLGSVNRGKSKHRPRNDPDLYGGKYPFIQTGDVKHSPFYVTSHSQTYNEKGLAQSKLWDEGTLCITIAANIADTAILSYPACFPDSIIGFIADIEKSNTKYVKYCLDTFKLQMQSISQGTTQDNMSAGKLLSIDFPAPDLQGQKKIAAILSAYDDLIENNKRRINLLEKMAEEIYREWFVRFRFPGYKNAEFEKGIPKGWGEVVFSNICKFEKGKNPDEVLDDIKDDAEIYINVESITGKGLSYAISQRNSVHCDIGDIVMLMDGSRSGLVFRANNNGIVGSTMSVIRTDESLKNYIYEYLKAMNEAIIFNNTGSAIPHANKDYINRMLVYIPADETLIEQFNEYYNSHYSMIENLRLQVRQLEVTKSMLLPRLISGKLSVENLDIQFPPSMQQKVSAAVEV